MHNRRLDTNKLLKYEEILSHKGTKPQRNTNRQKFSEKSQRKNPFSKGFVSVRARREGKNKLDDFLRALHFFVVKKSLCQSLSRFLEGHRDASVRE